MGPAWTEWPGQPLGGVTLGTVLEEPLGREERALSPGRERGERLWEALQCSRRKGTWSGPEGPVLARGCPGAWCARAWAGCGSRAADEVDTHCPWGALGTRGEWDVGEERVWEESAGM